MITDKDIAQALKRSSQKPSKDWQDATLMRLRAVSLENHVTKSSGIRISLTGASKRLASYLFPTSVMPFTSASFRNPLFIKTIGSLAAVCVLTLGTHAVANGATPDNAFLYAFDRGFERVEIAFAKIGGKPSVAHRHLAHASERVTEMEVLLHGHSAAAISLQSLLIETAYAQNDQAFANANVHAHIKLLADDYRNSLNTAIRILEEIAEDASSAVSVTAKARLAIAIEATTKRMEKRLEVNAETTSGTDEHIRATLKETVDTTLEARKKVRRAKARVDVQVRQQNKIVICHKGRTITIAAAAWAAHQKHGDMKNACPEKEEGTVGEEESDEQDIERDIDAHLETQLKICHKNTTITIDATAWAAHEKHGDIKHACAVDAVGEENKEEKKDEDEREEDEDENEEEDDEDEKDEKDEDEDASLEVEVEEELEAEVGVDNVLKANGNARGRMKGNAKVKFLN